MSDTPSRATEHPDAVRRAAGTQTTHVVCPVKVGAGQWCYERVKRSTSKIKVVTDWSGGTDFTRNVEFQKFVDFIKSDSLLACAVLEFGWEDNTVTFKNGTVVNFKFDS